MRVRFWGVRSGIPVPGSTTLRYGGNTACVEIRCRDRLLILDAGTGLRALGDVLVQEAMPLDATIFLTHSHLDRIIGLSSFAPLAKGQNRVCIWTPVVAELDDWFDPLVRPPYASVAIEQEGAHVEQRQFVPNRTYDLEEGLRITALGLGHSEGHVGLRIDHDEASLVYLPTVAPDEADTQAIAAFAQGTRLLICGETLERAVGLAQAAKAERLVLFHHTPEQTDKVLDVIGWDAATSLPGTEVASEGLVLRL